jgi:hypothetical protein
VLARRKQGFGAPTWRWLSSLQVVARRELLREELFEYFHESTLREVLRQTPTPRPGIDFWLLLNFALWHRHWIEQEDLREYPRHASASPHKSGSGGVKITPWT